ncbi:toluene efflux pump membrane transporter TtgH [bacterium BMS3Abin05]|nr:toluene efflux pump membrane transporter TtgH [bacterium BMS3Abin05]GBE27647.1 toluene efflux pump membrane transporter TtgH [bacterium BMS3Bbin03]HDZ12628.1 RND family transporter [Bacteroidota bacterium]
MASYFRFVIRKAGWVLALAFIITLFLGYEIKNLKVETDISAALPKGVPAKRLYDKVGKIFPSRDFILVVVESNNLFQTRVIAKIQALTKHFEDMPDVYSVMSPTNAKIILGTKEGIDVRDVLTQVPQTPEEMAAYRKRLLSDNIFTGNIISNDHKAAGIMLFLKKNIHAREAAGEVISYIKKNKGDLKILATGKPVVNYYLAKGMDTDMRRLFPLAILVVFFIPLFRFKRIKMVLIPLAVVIFSVIWTFGVMALVHSPLSHSTTIMPILLISIGVADGIHILNHYFSNSRFIKERDKLVHFTMMELHGPVIMTSVTTMIGFLALNTSRVTSLLQLGIFTSVGVFFAMILSISFIPAGLSLIKVPTQLKEAHGGRLEKLSHTYAKILIRYKWAVLIFIIVIVLLSIAGIPRIKLESSDIENFPPSHPLRLATAEVNDHFAGSNYIDVVVEGKTPGYIKNPFVLKKMAMLEDSIKTLPYVGGAISLVDFIRRINQVLHNNNPAYYRIPNETETETTRYFDAATGKWVHETYTVSGRKLIAQYLQLYEMSGKPEDFANLVDYNYETAKITAFLRTSKRTHLKKIDTWTRGFIKRHFDGIKADITGVSELYLAVNDLIVSGQLKSIFLSLFLVFLLTALMFRSFTGGLFNVLPLFFAMFLNFAVMGWFGIYLNLMTMVTSSIAIGVGVDYAIHFYHRYRMKFTESHDYENATDRTMEEAGVAIFINALTVAAGFAILLFSEFKGISLMGLLITLTMVWTSFGALTILPTLFMILKPKFNSVGGKQ